MAVALVDETGDPGTGGAGRCWFCWVAFIVADEFVQQMQSARKFLNLAFPGEHWPTGDFTGDDLIGTLRFMLCMPGWHWLAVASNTTFSKPTTAREIHVPTLHRYYTMLVMLERLSWLGEALGERVMVFVEKPNDAGFSQTSLRSRHEEGLRGKWANYGFLPAANIFLTDAHPLFCCAHTLALTVGKAVNPHMRRCQTIPGEVFPEYLNIVRKRVWIGPWRNCQDLTSMGFTLLPYRFRHGLRAQLPFLQTWLQEFDLPY